MKFQAFHVNPGKKLKKKDVNNDLSNFMSVFPTAEGFVTATNNSKTILKILMGWAMVLGQGLLSFLGRPRLPKDQSSMTMS